MRISRYSMTVAAFALVAAACGQYPGVHERAVRTGQYQAPPGAPGFQDTTTAAGGTAAGGGTVAGGGGTTSVSGGSTGTGGQVGGGAPGQSGGGGTPNAPAGGDTTGVTASTITIGIHAPLTGAASFKTNSFNTGKDQYWLRGNNGKPVKVYGRQVRVVFEDDHYQPGTARDKCIKMAQQDNAFLLVGGGGTDQIQACAQYAASQGIPYLSAGVTEVGLRGLPNYFALSKSYPQQVPMLADYIRQNGSKLGWDGRQERMAMVVTNTANFQDAVDQWSRAFPRAAVLRHEKNEKGYQGMPGRLCTGTVPNYDVVFPLTSPQYFVELSGAAKCNPQYVGVGITMGLDTVANNGCRLTSGGLEGARFFSPAPAVASSAKYDPGFNRAGGGDDIVWLFWGLSKTLHELFLKAGPNLTREGFIASTSQARVDTGVFPDIQYSPSDHFGAKQVHLLRVDCEGSGGKYVTDQAFVSSF